MEKNSASPNETELLGINFATKISRGDIIAVNGDLGSGKTTLIKGILKGLGYTKNVSSPTYTLINEYNALIKVVHIDCYREQDVNRWLDIGVMDYLNNNNNIVIIEWPKFLVNILPNDIINIYIKHVSKLERNIKFSL